MLDGTFPMEVRVRNLQRNTLGACFGLLILGIEQFGGVPFLYIGGPDFLHRVLEELEPAGKLGGNLDQSMAEVIVPELRENID
jgi:hypothetical protein